MGTWDRQGQLKSDCGLELIVFFFYPWECCGRTSSWVMVRGAGIEEEPANEGVHKDSWRYLEIPH